MLQQDPGAALREARLAKGLRQKDVAEAAGCSISLVSMTEGCAAGTQAREAMARAVGASLGSFWPPMPQ
jgi:transcriptional regulator with XRE-family HTH domain